MTPAHSDMTRLYSLGLYVMADYREGAEDEYKIDALEANVSSVLAKLKYHV